MYICNEFIDKVFHLYPGLYLHIGANAILEENSCFHTIVFSRYISTNSILYWIQWSECFKYLVKVLMDEIKNAPLENILPHCGRPWPLIKNNLYCSSSFYPILLSFCKQLNNSHKVLNKYPFFS